MSMTALGLGVALVLGLGDTGSPIGDVFAYSRETRPGIPPGPGVEASPDRSLETKYFIYVVLRAGSTPTGASVWLKGRLHDATLREVETPVTIERDPAVPTDERITLVPATSSPTYQVLPDEERPESDAAEEPMARDNDALVLIYVDGTSWQIPVETIEALPPAPGI